MPFTVLLCTDGSELAESALADGLAVVGPPDRVVVATAVEPVDPTLVVGTGLAGGVTSPTEAQPEQDERTAAAQRLRRALLGSVSDHVVRNAPCPVVTRNAAERPS
jgi:Universal stress protein family